MPYAVEPTVEGLRIVFSRKRFLWRTVVIGGVTAALWVGYFNNHSRHWSDLIWPGIFLAMFATLFINKESIDVDHEYLSRRVTFLGLTWTKRYKLVDVLNPHYEPEKGYGRNRVPSFLRFEYHGKAKSVLANVEPSEVESILTEIVQRFPELAARWKIRQHLYGLTDIVSLDI
jgi:hypothetical protein